jgi:hypothetical protein
MKAALSSSSLRASPASPGMVDSLREEGGGCSCGQVVPGDVEADQKCCGRGTTLDFTYARERKRRWFFGRERSERTRRSSFGLSSAAPERSARAQEVRRSGSRSLLPPAPLAHEKIVVRARAPPHLSSSFGPHLLTPLLLQVRALEPPGPAHPRGPP